MRIFMAALVCGVMLALTVPAPALSAAVDATPVAAKKSAGPLLYLLRGGGDVFSLGMNSLARELTARGIPAAAVGFTGWRDLADKLAVNYRTRHVPVVIIGHSWGANAAILMARTLEESRIPVALIVLYDVTASQVVPPNVARVINFRSLAAIGMNVTVTGGFGFRGRIETVDSKDVDHIQVDKSERLHKLTIDAVVRAMGGRAHAAAQ
jgi:hypothetical protein